MRETQEKLMVKCDSLFLFGVFCVMKSYCYEILYSSQHFLENNMIHTKKGRKRNECILCSYSLGIAKHICIFLSFVQSSNKDCKLSNTRNSLLCFSDLIQFAKLYLYILTCQQRAIESNLIFLKMIEPLNQ